MRPQRIGYAEGMTETTYPQPETYVAANGQRYILQPSGPCVVCVDVTEDQCGNEECPNMVCHGCTDTVVTSFGNYFEQPTEIDLCPTCAENADEIGPDEPEPAEAPHDWEP